jgi:DNA repair exonuclease SbcCD ATPase subunit
MQVNSSAENCSVKWVGGQLDPASAGQWEDMVIERIKRRTPEELEAIRQARAAMREHKRGLHEEIPEHVLKASLDQLEKEAQRELDQAMQNSQTSIEAEAQQDLDRALEASQQEAVAAQQAAVEEATRLSMEIEDDEMKLVMDNSLADYSKMMAEKIANDDERKALQESIMEQLRQYYPEYLAAYGAANASDIESAEEAIEKLQKASTSPAIEGASTKKQVYNDLIALGYMPYLAEIGAENATDTMSAIDVITKLSSGNSSIDHWR